MAQTMSQALIARLGANLSDFKKGMRSAVRESENAGQRMKANIGKATQAAKALVKGMALVAAAITGIGILAVREFVQWEEALTGVAKTVDATNEEIQALGRSFVKMSEVIPVSASELAKLGEVAGQLGVDLPNIKEFVQTAAALGVSTNLMAEDAATGLARFSNVMGTSISDVDKLGSTIVDLGNNLATTEREILEMSLRLTGVGKQVGLAESQVLGFSAALSSLGIRSEAGGSAFSRVFAEMASEVASGGDRLKEFARVAGQTVTEFQASFRDDAAEAVIAFIAGLDKLGKEGENVFGILEKVEFADIRVRDSLLRAAGGVDLLRESMEIGNRAWDENTALTKEAERFYDRVGARLVALRNKISNVAAEMGESLTPIVETSISVVSGFLDKIREFGPALARFAESAAQSIPGMVQKIVQGVGEIGLKLLSVVEFFRDNPIAGGLGLVGLVFLGPQGAAALGAIGFVIDSIIQKLGGPTTVAEALNQKLSDAIALQEGLLGQAKAIQGLGVPEGSEAAMMAAGFLEEAKQLGVEILGIRRTIQGLTEEDFREFGSTGADTFGRISDGLRTVLEGMKEFEVTFAGGGVAEVAQEAAESFESMRMSFAPLPLITGEMTANLDTAAGKAARLALQFRDKVLPTAKSIASTVADGIGNAITGILFQTQRLTEAMVRLGKTIVSEVVSALIRATIVSSILNAILPGGGGAASALASRDALAAGKNRFASGGVVPGAGATPIIAHAGEVVLSREAVASLGGASQANQLNQSAPAAQPVNVSLSVDASKMPEASDFGIIATNPQLVRFVSELMRQVEFVRT